MVRAVSDAARIQHRKERALYVHRVLFRFAAATGNTFAWVFIFHAFYIANASVAHSLAGTAILYALSQLVTLMLTPLSGMWLRSGIRRALFYGIAAAGLAYLLQSFMFLRLGSDESVYWAISMFTLFIGAHRALYWIPYRTTEAEVHSHPTAMLYAREAAIALVPFFAGLVVGKSVGGAPFVLVAAGALSLASIIPLVILRESTERFSWTYGETWRELFSRRHRRRSIIAICDGLQGAGLFLVWPLGIFTILGWSYTVLGLVMSLTLLASLALRRPMRSLLRLLTIDRSPKIGAAVVFSAWILRLTAATPLQIISIDVYHQASVSPRRFNADMLTLEQVADAGHYIDEDTALTEMALSIGRILMALLLAIVSILASDAPALVIAILVAAFAAATSVLLAHSLRPAM